jgi:hypothetical protein
VISKVYNNEVEKYYSTKDAIDSLVQGNGLVLLYEIDPTLHEQVELP